MEKINKLYICNKSDRCNSKCGHEVGHYALSSKYNHGNCTDGICVMGSHGTCIPVEDFIIQNLSRNKNE